MRHNSVTARTQVQSLLMANTRSTVYVWSSALALHLILSVVGQAPGDGDPICTDQFLDGITNPFFATRPTYSPNERPLMDSRDYVGLLQGGDNLPWQSVDNDNNNTAGVATTVSVGAKTLQFSNYSAIFSSGFNRYCLLAMDQ